MTYESYYPVIWGTAFFTAIVSAVVGMIGGSLLLAVMAQYLKMEVLIPLHGLIQFLSNGSRAWLLRSSIITKIVTENIFGVLIGSLVGAVYVIRIDEAYYNIFLGLFILLITFLPKFQAPFKFRGRWALLGFVASFIGLYVGAIGVLVGSFFLAEKLEKREYISTQAACQTALHFAKVLVFVYLGFTLTPWITLLAGTWLLTILGTWVGTRILERIPNKFFTLLVKIIISALAIRLLYKGLFFTAG